MCSAPKKVLFIHHGGGIGGAPVSMLQLAATLDRDRYIPLAIFTQNGPILEFAHELGVPARVYPLPSAVFYSAHVPMRIRMLATLVLFFWPTVRAARRLVRNEQPDLVHLNTSVLIPAALGIRQEGVPLVWHVREVPGPNPLLRRWQTKIISHFSDEILVNSQYVRDAFPKDVKATVTHNAIQLERFQIKEEVARMRVRTEFRLSPSSKIVGMIGSVQEVKGHYLLVKAAREVVRKIPEARFLIVAGSVDSNYPHSWKGRIKHLMGWPMDNMDRMHRMVHRLGLEEHFVFAGFRQNITELLAAMDVLAFIPQADEGFGRPIIEAMAAGRPVVATDVGPSREVLGNYAGLLVPPSDERALAQALIILLEDQHRSQCMGTIGRKRAIKFDVRQHAAQVEEVYVRVLTPE